MSHIDNLINKKPTLILKYGVFFTLIYFLIVLIVLKNIKYNTNTIFRYEYIGEGRVGVCMSLKEYQKITDNQCQVSFTYNNVEYEIKSQITNKNFVNNRTTLTLSNVRNYEYIDVAKNGVLKVANLDTTVGDVIWMGIINNINF